MFPEYFEVNEVDGAILIKWAVLQEIGIIAYSIFLNNKLQTVVYAKNPSGNTYQEYEVKLNLNYGLYTLDSGAWTESYLLKNPIND